MVDPDPHVSKCWPRGSPACRTSATSGGAAVARCGVRWCAFGSLHPALVVVEKVAALRWRTGGMDVVLGDLAETGYDRVWNRVRARGFLCGSSQEGVFILLWPRDRHTQGSGDHGPCARRGSYG